jgi:acetylornithine deacetylase/succinyl-diaminopimelate desuccinylase-like protein
VTPFVEVCSISVIYTPVEREMLQALSDFVAIESVSNTLHREDCRQAAIWLKKHLSQLGANSMVVDLSIHMYQREQQAKNHTLARL